MITWPKIIKLGDVADQVDALDQRITALEAYVGRNDARITALETRQHADAEGLAAHQAGATQRQNEIDQLRGQLERQAWAARTGRQP